MIFLSCWIRTQGFSRRGENTITQSHLQLNRRGRGSMFHVGVHPHTTIFGWIWAGTYLSYFHNAYEYGAWLSAVLFTPVGIPADLFVDEKIILWPSFGRYHSMRHRFHAKEFGHWMNRHRNRTKLPLGAPHLEVNKDHTQTPSFRRGYHHKYIYPTYGLVLSTPLLCSDFLFLYTHDISICSCCED